MARPDTNPSVRHRAAGVGAGLQDSGVSSLVVGSIVVAAIYLGRDLLVPLVLAVLLAFVLAPLVRLLLRARLGNVGSTLVAVLLAVAFLGLVGVVVSTQVADLASNLPSYQATIQAKVRSLHLGELFDQANAMMRTLGGDLSRPEGGIAPDHEMPAPAIPAVPVRPVAAPAGNAFDFVLSVAGPLLHPLATAGVVVVFAIFVLLYREDLRDRLIRLAGSRDLHRTTVAMNDAAYRLSRLFLAQVMLNTAFGVFIAAGLWIIGLPNPVLWGILAGLMRFVPFVGILVAVVPTILLALAVDPGWGTALWVTGLFLASEPIMGQVFEPLVLGHQTGLSPISVIVSATFWTFMWGPIGLLLAAPLTVCLVVVGRHVERLGFIEVMLGDAPPLLPQEAFYQRALEGHADGLLELARRSRKEAPLSAFYDEVALRGLALANADWSREVLAPERLEGIHAAVETLVEELAEDAEVEAPAAAVDPAWTEDAAVLCVAGRGRFDDLAAAMAGQVLRHAGFGARAEGNAVLGADSIGRLDPTRARLVLLSLFEEGSSAAGVRYFLRRLKRQLPEARVAIGLWHAPADSPVLAALRAEGGAETIATSLREVVALCGALGARAAEPEAGPVVVAAQ